MQGTANNDAAGLCRIYWRELSSVVTDGEDEKLEKKNQFFQVFKLSWKKKKKLLWLLFILNFIWYFLLILQEHFVRVKRLSVIILAQNWPEHENPGDSAPLKKPRSGER